MRRALLTVALLLTCAWPLSAQTQRVTPVDATGAAVGTQANPIKIQEAESLGIAGSGYADFLGGVVANTTGDGQGVFPGALVLVVTCSGCAGGTTVSWEASSDNGVTYYPLTARQLGTGTAAPTFATSTTTAGVTYWAVDLGGAARARANVTNYSAGTVTVTGFASWFSTTGSVWVANGTAATPMQVSLANTGANSTAVKVDGSASTQPISAASLPLPTSAATSTKQSDGSQKSQIVDGSGNVIGATSNALDVNIKSGGGSGGTASTFGAAFPATGTAIGAKDSGGTNMAALNLDASGNLKVAVTGAGSGGTSSADGDAYTAGTTAGTPAMGVRDDTGTATCAEDKACLARLTSNRALMVDLSATGANTTAIKVDGSAVTQPVSGTVSITANSAVNVAQINGVTTSMGNGASGTGVQRVTIANDSTGTIAATQSGTWNVTNVSGTVSLPTGASTSANQSTEITALQLIDNLPNTLGSTTSGQSGALALGAVTTSAPSYTTAQSNALSLTTAGALRTDASATTQPVSGTVSITANSSVNVAQLAGTTTDTNSGTKSAGTLRVVLATDQPQLTNKLLVTPDANSAVNLAQMNGAALASPDGNSYAISPNAATATSGAAASACNILSAASTNSTNCKASAGNLYGYEIFNTSTTVYYLRLYNLSSAPTCSSATGFIRSIPIPPAAAAGQVGGAVSNQGVPVNFGTGIGYCITGGSSSTDNTNAATGIFGEIRYK